jgi:outer membrane biosynthesis protein TonB
MKRLAALFVALGFKNAGSWDESRMASRVAKIGSVEYSGELDEENQELLDSITDAQERGEEIETSNEEGEDKVAKKSKTAEVDVESTGEEKPVKAKKSKKDEVAVEEKPAKKPTKPAKEEKPVKSKKTKPSDDDDETPKKKEKASPTNTAGKKGVGILKGIIALLKQAGEKGKPITREKITEKLAAKYPERDPKGLRVTVFSQVPLRLIKVKNLDVQNDGEGGYWIPPGE